MITLVGASASAPSIAGDPPEPVSTYLEAELKLPSEPKAVVLSVPKPKCTREVSPALKQAMRSLTTAKAKEWKVNPRLAEVLIEFESAGFNPYACNPRSTAKGLAQFIDGTWNTVCRPWGYKDVFNPEDNLDCAMRLLASGQIQHWTADPRTRDVLRSHGFAS